ncbi:MAG: hypothetical protein QN120_14410 [Armatimonadota bacterium]|nr:hypothetical protein [Armatimonadota bacterium]
MPSQTQGKLDEARYFLDRMKETQATRVPFVYYFNASTPSCRRPGP